MSENKQSPAVAAASQKIAQQRRSSSPRQSAFGHALDGSQQLDILEEQIYANTEAPGKDQPIVPARITLKK